ncbi:acyltransferase family protein [Dyadobacter sp.]|uniref:acyltransferase family protein n=1 Tax=Dyadobacter sp. TaxID=1914288 RepID=UPI003F709265
MNNDLLGTKPHYQILDGLRGVAAIIVVCFHLTEPLASSRLDNVVNHGYLAVDFFFLLSGFVIGYAYDDRWDNLSIGGFLRRRFERLHPLVVLGMTLGAIGFYFTDSPIWPLIDTVPVWKLIVVMLIGWTLLPVPLSMDIRGWFEMHPLNSVGWSLFFEYIANILYALGLRKLSNTALACFVVLAGAGLVHLAVTSPNGDVTGGWTLNAEHMRIGIIRTMFPFFGGLLLSRVARPIQIKNAFLWCSLLTAAVLLMPRIGGAANLWMNGLYEAVCIIIIIMKSGITVYLADDDEDDRFLIKEAINQVHSQINIIEAENGLELLNVIKHPKAQKAELILLDMNMPMMNGIEAALAIRKDPALGQVPIAMISTASNSSFIEQAYKAGVSHYYTKPSSFEGFISLANQLGTDFKF